MEKQYLTFCKFCGKQILMTHGNRGWIPCNPVIMRFRRSGGPETFISEDGEFCRGVRDRNGEFGYKSHRKDCVVS